MAWIILLILAAFPLLELSVLIDVGSSIGGFQTILLCLLTAGIGMSLVRLQGLQVFAKMQTASLNGEEVGENLIHGFFLMVAGIFLFIPGFITDAIGGLLLIPHLRLAIAKAGFINMVVRNKQNRGHHSNSQRRQNDDIIIEGEYSDQSNDAPKDTLENK
jgi:UPF0716 protein FxsA